MVIKESYKRIARSCEKVHKSKGDSHNRTKKFSIPPIASWLSFVGSLTGWYLINSSSLQAQITTDGTTGTEVNTSLDVTEITGGTRADSNLFHSFQDFSVETGNTAFFNNASDISNIVGRVTGGNISSIDGLIRANGNANLILINPSGINFGANASLDIGGSFLGSTADSLIFEDGTVFSATDTQAEPILTISVPVGLQLGQNSEAIQVTGTGNLGSDLEANPGLVVTPGNTFALVGNGITFNGGVVTAESGRIDLGSVAAGEVSITEIAAGWQLGYEAVTQLAALELLAESSLGNPNFISNPDGGIQLQGNNITLERSQVTAPTLGNSPGADINLKAVESISLKGLIEDDMVSGSQILNEVSAEASGNGGEINIETGRLNIEQRSFISTTTFGAGDGGNVNVQASDINITGTGFAEFQQTFQLGALSGTLQPEDRGTGIFIGTVTTGEAGSLTIDTGSLSLSEGSIIFSPLFTAGMGGDINVNATDIEISASALQGGGRPGSVESALSGDINLETERLIVRDGGTIANGTVGDAVGGDINLTAAESIELRDSPIDSLILTGIYSNTLLGSGAGGNININTGNLTIEDALISSNTGALLADGTILSVGGLGGSINIQADEGIEARGIPANPLLITGISTTTFTSSDAGNLEISTGKLIIRDGAEFGSATLGAGNGGKLTINATDSVELIGITTIEGLNRGGLLASSGRTSFPNEATNASGDIDITTPELTVQDGASIDLQSLGLGDAGNLNITANSIVLNNKGSLSASTQSGVGGSVRIDTDTIQLNRGLINASILGDGTGGNIEIRARDSVEVIGSGFDSLQGLFFAQSFPDLESLANFEFGLITEGIIAATTGKANAGTISIETANLQIREGGLVATATAGDGIAGSIFLNASESLKVDASIVSSSSLFTGQGGDIAINTENLEALAGAQITTSTLGFGNSGSLTIDATESITVAGRSTSNIFSNISVGAEPLPTTTGNGGDLTITTTKLNIDDGGIVSVNSTGTGDAGTLGINADSILLNRRGAITADTQSGGGGNIFLDAENIILQGNSNTSARAVGVGDGGNITINANNIVALEGSQISADAIQGMGGNIQIDTQGLFVCGECQISASSRLGIDGRVNIETLEPDLQLEVIDLAQQPTQAQEAVAVACSIERQPNTSELTITGRGGLPPRPKESLSSESIIVFDAPVDQVKQPLSSATKKASRLPPPARSWYVDAKGTVVLTAQAPGTVPDNSPSTIPDCHVDQTEGR